MPPTSATLTRCLRSASRTMSWCGSACSSTCAARLSRLVWGARSHALCRCDGLGGTGPHAARAQIFIKGPHKTGAASIILRGANEYMLDEMERSVHDALCVIKRTLESNRVVPGGGCVEAALSIFLENYATTLVRDGHAL